MCAMSYPQTEMGVFGVPNPLGALLNMTPLDSVLQKHLRKVYTSLGGLTLFCALGAYAQMQAGISLQFLSVLLTFGTLMYFHSLPSHSPQRRPLFYAFGFLEGWTLGPLMSLLMEIDPSIVFTSALAAAAVFVSLSVSAFFAKRRSYMYLGGVLLAGLSSMIVVEFVTMFVLREFGFKLQLYFGLLLFVGFTLFDSQMIVERAHAGVRDDLKDALTLFMDLLQIFVRLAIIMARNAESKKKDDERKNRK